MNEIKSHFDHVVEPFSDDYKGFLSWSMLGNLLLRIAQKHASQGGFGYEQMIGSNNVWVLSRLIIDMDSFPRTGDKFAIETWVNRIYRQFTDRHFAILDENGKQIGGADSVWALINMETRQPLDLSSMPGGTFENLFDDRETGLAPATRYRMKNAESEGEYTVKYSDLDINGHLNSIRYLMLILDVLASKTNERPDVNRVELQFCAECYLGDIITIKHERLEVGEAFEIIRPDGVVAFKALCCCKQQANG